MRRKSGQMEIGFHERMLRLKRAGMRSPLTSLLGKGIQYDKQFDKGITNLRDRVVLLIQWLQQYKIEKSDDMLYFVMYDITDNKVRNLVAKYLIKKGCIRVQKSVYLAKSKLSVYKEISQVLKEVNEVYKNEDSIMILPVSEDKLHSMKVIGKNIEFELVTKEENVLII